MNVRIAARICAALAALWVLSSPAMADCNGQFAAGQVCGNSGTSADFPSPISGVDTNALMSKTANYTVAAADCGKTIQLGTGSTGYFTLTFPAVAGFASTCSIVAINSDTGRGKSISGLTGISMLWPSQALGAKIVNGAWALTYNPGLWTPLADVTFCVNVTSGSDTADGLTPYSMAAGVGSCTTPAQAFRTVQHCIDVVSAQLLPRLDIMTPTCKIADTTSVAEFFNLRQFNAGGYVYQLHQPTISGNCTTPGNVIVKGASSGIVINAGANVNAWTLDCFDIAPTLATDAGIFGDWNSNINLKSIRFTSAMSVGITSRYGSRIEILAGAAITISANMSAFINATQQGLVLGQGSPGAETVTLTGTPAFANAFVTATSQSFVDLQSITFVGAATGARYSAADSEIIPAGTSLPGNAAGLYFTCYSGSTSGSACLGAPAVAGASGLLLLPANLNDTLVSKTSTDILTNKTIDGSQLVAASTARSKMSAEAQSTIIGRAAGAGSGDPTDLTATQVATIIDTPLAEVTVAVDFNSANTDFAITVPTRFTKYRCTICYTTNTGTTASLTTARMGIFSGTGGGGVTLTADAALSAITTNAADTLANTLTQSTSGTVTFTRASTPTIYARVSTAQGAAASGTITCQFMGVQ